MDYTPGYFRNGCEEIKSKQPFACKFYNRKSTGFVRDNVFAFANGIALSEYYKQFSDAFQFIKDVPVDWQDL